MLPTMSYSIGRGLQMRRKGLWITFTIVRIENYLFESLSPFSPSGYQSFRLLRAMV
jgi:hypothetical protein